MSERKAFLAIFGVVVTSCSEMSTVTTQGEGACSVAGTVLACDDGTRIDMAGRAAGGCTIAAGVLACSDGARPIGSEEGLACSIASDLLTCEDGRNTSIGGLRAVGMRKELRPGESVIFEHGLRGALVRGQYIEGETVHELFTYPHAHSPIVGAPVENFMSEALGTVKGHVLSNGHYLLMNHDAFSIVRSDGVELVAKTLLPEASGCLFSAGAALATGGFVVAESDCHRLFVHRYDDAGRDVGFDGGAIRRIVTATVSTMNPALAATDDGGFLLGAVYTSSVGDVRRLARYDAKGRHVATPVREPIDTFYRDNEIAVLDDGRFVWVFAERDDHDRVRSMAVVYDEAGARIMAHPLSGTDVGAVRLAQAPDNHLLVAYALRGPDAMAYVVLDGSGNLVAGPRTLSGFVPGGIAAGVFGDGDFVVGMTDRTRSSGVMWNVSRRGQLQHREPIEWGEGQKPDATWPIFTSGEDTVTMVYGVEAGPGSYLVRVGKNLVPVETSSTSAVVRNGSAHLIDVVLAAFDVSDERRE